MTVRIAERWELPQVFALRQEVFVNEQGVDPAIERDREDAHCLHVLAEDAGAILGCCRLIPEADALHMGRLAVEISKRGQGIGTLICRFAAVYAKENGYRRVVLNAQSHAIPFYEKAGFCKIGTPFWEAGMEHMAMVLTVAE